jgi:hypothetical protein
VESIARCCLVVVQDVFMAMGQFESETAIIYILDNHSLAKKKKKLGLELSKINS